MQHGTMSQIDTIGKGLSKFLDCTIHISDNGKVFMCKHGIMFSSSRLAENVDWSWAKKKHDDERNVIY